MKHFLSVVIFLAINSTNVRAQLTNGGTLANFTIDADTRVGYAKSGTTTLLAYNNDDWFLPTSYPGTGKGVIDTTGTSTFPTPRTIRSARRATPATHRPSRADVPIPRTPARAPQERRQQASRRNRRNP